MLFHIINIQSKFVLGENGFVDNLLCCDLRWKKPQEGVTLTV